MSIAPYAYESNESKCIKKGASKLYIKDDILVYFDGVNEHMLPLDQYDPTVNTNDLPYITTDNAVETKEQTVASSIDNVARLLAVLLTAITVGDTIKFNGDITLNGVRVTGISNAGSSEVQLFSQEYYDAHKDELKGEKGDKGDKGDKVETGPQGPQGPSGLDGEDGEDGDSAKSWLWDLINSGVSAAALGGVVASYDALQTQVVALQTQILGMAVKDLSSEMVDQAQTIFEGVADAVDSVSQGEKIFTKIAKVVKEAWTKITTNYRLIQGTSYQVL